MKKLVSLLLVAVLLCFSVSALAYSPEEPITIQFWHTRGSGAQQETMNYQIDAFNETVGKEKGIEVDSDEMYSVYDHRAGKYVFANHNSMHFGQFCSVSYAAHVSYTLFTIVTSL